MIRRGDLAADASALGCSRQRGRMLGPCPLHGGSTHFEITPRPGGSTPRWAGRCWLLPGPAQDPAADRELAAAVARTLGPEPPDPDFRPDLADRRAAPAPVPSWRTRARFAGYRRAAETGPDSFQGIPDPRPDAGHPAAAPPEPAPEAVDTPAAPPERAESGPIRAESGRVEAPGSHYPPPERRNLAPGPPDSGDSGPNPADSAPRDDLAPPAAPRSGPPVAADPGPTLPTSTLAPPPPRQPDEAERAAIRAGDRAAVARYRERRERPGLRRATPGSIACPCPTCRETGGRLRLPNFHAPPEDARTHA